MDESCPSSPVRSCNSEDAFDNDVDDIDLHHSGGRLSSNTKALVCEACWTKVFDTKALQAFWQGQSPTFEYEVHWQQLLRSVERGCNWCSFLKTQMPNQEESTWPSNWTSDIQLTINIEEARIMPNAAPEGLNNHCEIDFGTQGSSRDWHVEMELFADSEATAKWITARPLQLDVDCIKAYRQVGNWLNACSTHTECPKAAITNLPTRILQISSVGSPEELRLLVTKGMQGRYLALSYCWGEQQAYMLIEKNLQSFTQEIDLTEVSQTVRDAVKVTRELGYEYLWVDALCIVQDSEEDKIRELAYMDEIYRNSLITIVAASASAAADGFLKPRANSRQSFEIPFRCAADQISTLHIQEYRPYYDLDEPASHIRVPHFTVEVSHTDVQSRRLLSLPSSKLRPRLLPVTSRIVNLPGYGSTGSPLDSVYEDLPRSPLIQDWIKIVVGYSYRSATLPSDKLTALAGIAKYLCPVFGPRYFAGIWEKSILPQLCWNSPSNNGFLTRPAQYRAPSWSWASVEGPLYFHSYDPGVFTLYRCEVVSCETTLRNASLPFGEVSSGHLKLRAVLKKGRFEASTSRKITWDGDPRFPHISNSDSDLDSDAAIGVSDTAHDNFDGSVECLPFYTFGVYKKFNKISGMMLVRIEDGLLRRIGRFEADQAFFEYLPQFEVTIV